MHHSPTTPAGEWEETKWRIAQAILGALEYRGFYDAGKYLDDDITEAVRPFIAAAEERGERNGDKKWCAVLLKHNIISQDDIDRLQALSPTEPNAQEV